MKRAVAAALTVLVFLQAPLEAALVNNTNKVADTVQIGPNPISINIPPTTWVSLALNVAQILIGEAHNKEVNERLVRIDAKLDAILLQMGLMTVELRSISAKLDYISDQLTALQQTAELIPARTAAHIVNGRLKALRARMPAYVANRRNSATQREIRGELSALENETDTLTGYQNPTFYLTAGTSILIQRDLAELLTSSVKKPLVADEFTTELNEMLAFFDQAVSTTAVDNGSMTVNFTDSYPVRKAKLTRALAAELPIAKTHDVPAFPACLDSEFSNTVTIATGLVWRMDFNADEYVVPVMDVDTGFCTKAVIGLQKSSLLTPGGGIDANWLVHGTFTILGDLRYDTRTSRFVVRNLFYYPHNVSGCELDCNATRCRGAVTFTNGARNDCTYGVLAGSSKRTKASLAEFSTAWSPLFREHGKEAEDLLKKHVARANQLILEIADAKASMTAIQALRASVATLQTSR